MYKKSLNKKSLKNRLIKSQVGGSTNPFPFTLRQLTGTRTPYSSYMPVDPNQRGSAMFALGTLGEAVGNLFGGKDRDRDGLMDGAFRDLRAKRRRFKDSKGFGFTYKDQQGNPVIGDPRELYKASKDPNYTPRSPQQMMQDYQTYSRFGTDDQGRLQSFITDRPFDKRDFTNKGRLRNFIQENVNSGKPLMPKFFNEVTTPEEAYQQMQPASQFDFSPFMPKQQTTPVTNTVTKPASGVSSGSTAVNTQTDQNASAVINGVTYTASDPPDNTANTSGTTTTKPATPASSKTLSSADQFFNPYATKNFQPITYTLQDGTTKTYKTADDLYKGIIDPSMSYVDAERLFEAGYGRIDNNQFTQLTSYVDPTMGHYKAADNYLTSPNQVTNWVSGKPATYKQYGLKTGAPKRGIQTDVPGFASASQPVQDMLRMVHFNTGIDPRVFVADASGAFDNTGRIRGNYSVATDPTNLGDIGDIYTEDMLKNVDAQKLLNSINSIYRSIVANTAGLEDQNPSYAKRVQFLADRYGLQVPQNTYTPAKQRGGKIVGIEKYNDQSVPVYSGSWNDVYKKAREDYGIHGSPVVYWDGKPMSILSAKEVGAYAPSSDDDDYVPYLPGKSKEEARKEFGDAGISRYNKFINASDKEKVRMLEDDRYNRAISDASEKVISEKEAEASARMLNNQAFAEQEKRKEELSRLQQGMDNVRVARPDIPVDYTNIEDELSYQSGPSLRKEDFSNIVNNNAYIDYDPEIQQIYGVPKFAVEAGDVSPEFLMSSSELSDVPVISDVAYNTMKENLSEKDFNKWYSSILSDKESQLKEGLKESFEKNLPNKKAYEADKAKKDAEFKAYQEGSILDKINRRAEYAIENPFRAVVSGYTDPIINLYTDDKGDVDADDYIYDKIYGTSTAGKGSVLRGTNQFGFGENNLVDMLSPIKPVYDATGSLMNVVSGEGNLTDAANIGLGALEVLPITKAPKAIVKGLKSFGKVKPSVPTTLPAPSIDIVSPSIDILSGSFKKGGMKKAQMGGLSKLLIEGLGQGQKLAKKMNFSDFYKSANKNPLKFTDDYKDILLNLKNSPDAPDVDVMDYLKFVDDVMSGKPTDLAKSVDDVDAMISSGLVKDRLKSAGYSNDDILKNAVDLIGQKINPFDDYRFDKLLPRGPYTKSPFTFTEGNQYLFKHTPQEKIGESVYKKDSQFFKPGSLTNPYTSTGYRSHVSNLPVEVKNKFFTNNPTSPTKLSMQGENFLQQFGPTLPQIMDGANPAQFLDVTRKTATLPFNLNKYGGEKAQLGKLVKTLGKYADNVLGTTTKVADDVTYTPEQLSNYNYAVDMGVPGVKKQNPGNLDEFLSGSFNKMPVYRTVDLNTDVIKQQPVIDDMISKGFNPDDKLDIASYMGTNTPLEILQDFNKGRRSIHSDILQGSGKDLLYTSDNPDWLIPNYGGSDPYMVKMFLDEKPATVVDQINALSPKFRTPANDVAGLTSVPQYNLLGSNPTNISDVPSGSLVDNLYKGRNTIYPILGDFGQQVRQPVRVASADDFSKIRARGEEFQVGGGVYDFNPFGPSSGFRTGKPVYDVNQNNPFLEPIVQDELPEDPPQEETQDDFLNFNLPNQDLVSPYTNTNIGTSTTSNTTTEDEGQQITRERIPGSGLYRTLMSPGMGMFTETSDAVVGVGRAVNDVFDNLNYQRAMNNQQRGTMADNFFATTYAEQDPLSQGIYDANTGLKFDVIQGRGPTGFDSFGAENYYVKYGGEIELDTDTIAELIAAGADIEIL